MFSMLLQKTCVNKGDVMMYQISETGKQMLQYQDELAKEHKYAPIQPDLFHGDVRALYRAVLPAWCNINGDTNPLCSADGTVLCFGYRRIVIGDYGAFVEISPEEVILSSLCCKPGQEYRYQDERYSKNVKYLWLTTKDTSDCKVYLQRKTVEYADYLPGMYYISVYEVFPIDK